MRRSIVGLTCGCAVNNEDTVRFSEQIGIRPHVKTFTLDKVSSALWLSFFMLIKTLTHSSSLPGERGLPGYHERQGRGPQRHRL